MQAFNDVRGKVRSSLDLAKQRMEEKVMSSGLGDSVSKLRENASLSIQNGLQKASAISILPQSLRNSEDGPVEDVSSEPSSGDEPATEKERLVGSEDCKRGNMQLGLNTLSSIGNTISSFSRAGQAKVASSIEKVCSYDAARKQRSPGVPYLSYRTEY